MLNDKNLMALTSIESEQAVLGAILIQNEALDHCEKLQADMFFNLNHRLIYRAMQDMQAASLPIDVITLNEYLTARKLCDENILFYLIEVQQHTPGTANVRSHARHIIERYTERQMALTGEEIKALAFERNGRSIADRQAEAVTKLMNIADQAAEIKEECTYIQALQNALQRK